MKRRVLFSLIIIMLIFTTVGCSFNNKSDTDKQGEYKTESGETKKRVAKDGAKIQKEDSNKSTRVLENGTKIVMHFDDTKIEGLLNDSKTAKALVEKLKDGPITIHESRYSHDFCGTVERGFLPYDEDDVHYGWLNGDIDYAIDAPYFTILFEDEDESEQYGSQVNIGIVTSPLSTIRNLNGSFDVRIELANE